MRNPDKGQPGAKRPAGNHPLPGCTGKRRYRSQGDALDAVAVLGLARSRKAYLCQFCGYWHLTSAGVIR